MTKYDDMLAQVAELQEMYDQAAKAHEAKLKALRVLIQETKEREAGGKPGDQTDSP